MYARPLQLGRSFTPDRGSFSSASGSVGSPFLAAYSFAAAALAASLNPYGVLARGYTVASVGGTVTPVEHLAPGQTVTLRGDKAEADCTVLTVRKPERNATL